MRTYRGLTTVERFWSRVDKQDSCWVWTGKRDRDGYGVMSAGPHGSFARYRRMHRFSYELINGPIPEGLVIDHLCRNPSCVNPKHLEAVTVKENTRRGNGPAAKNALKTKCKSGHELIGRDVGIDYRGDRYCKACARIRARKRNHQLKGVL